MIISVLVEISHKNIDKTFDYFVPSNLIDKIKIGIKVTVPFNNQILEGFVLGIKEFQKDADLKEVIDVVDSDIILNEELLELGKYMSEKTLATLISCYQVMLPRALKARQRNNFSIKTEDYISLNIDKKDIGNYKFTDKQLNIINILLEKKEVKKEILNNISPYIVKKLLNDNIIKKRSVEVYRSLDDEENDIVKYSLTVDQRDGVNGILKYSGSSNTFLIHGVTGSGKTEVYMELIDNMLVKGKTSILLVPEISLTPQMVMRFKTRFTSSVAVLHSGLSEGEKYDEYRRIARGEVNVVIGARSAIFAPLTNIGLIVIDEEHTSSYKQDHNPKYNAIDIAIKRSKYHNALVVLGSATPSLDSYAKALKGVYKLINLPNRVNKKEMPKVEIIDMGKEKKKGNYLSQKLIDAINNTLEKKEQIILLLNRRGYSSYITCSNCGYALKCPNCDITLTYHKTSNTLRCHYCGFGEKKTDICPSCGEESIKNLGYGTEKIEEELKNIFNARVIRMDFDTTTKKGSHKKIIESFKNHEYDILLGTQMIAKGLDFSNVTLVGVISADTSLLIPSYNSSESTFQLLCQVSGRSGRGEKEGSVIIQTFNPDHYAVEYSKNHDYISFFKREMSIRRSLSYPPYYYLISIRVISSDYELARDTSNKVAAYLKRELTSSVILGPSISNVFKINNKYRFLIIIKYKKETKLYSSLNTLLEHYRNNSKINLDFDFNPNNI